LIVAKHVDTDIAMLALISG